MKFASAVYWGGDILDAEDCNYNTYKDVGTVCPFCSNAVFLRASTNRRVQGKDVKVSACFVHFKQTPESEACEARALTAEGRKQLEAIQAKKKNQRLRVFNERLWDVFKAAHDNKIHYRVQDIVRDLKKFEVLNSAVAYCRTKLKRYRLTTLQDCSEMVRLIIQEENPSFYILPGHESDHQYYLKQISDKKQYFVGANVKLHAQITAEVLDFLLSKSGRQSLETFVCFNIHKVHEEKGVEIFDLLDDPDGGNKVFLRMARSLYQTPWGLGIARLPPAKGFGKNNTNNS